MKRALFLMMIVFSGNLLAADFDDIAYIDTDAQGCLAEERLIEMGVDVEYLRVTVPELRICRIDKNGDYQLIQPSEGAK